MQSEGSKERFTRHIRNIRSLELQKDDVLVIAYPKSGFHWIWEVLYRLMTGKTTLPDGKFMEEHFLEFSQLHSLQTVRPRVFFSHLTLRQLPENVMTSKCHVIYMLRDPRAVVVSLYEHLQKMKSNMREAFTGTFTEFLALFLKESVIYKGWFSHTKHWEAAIPRLRSAGNKVLVMHYEDFVQSPVMMVKRIAEFLGKNYSFEFCGEIVKQTSIDVLRARHKEDKTNPTKRLFQGNQYPFYRKGTTDNWKSWFTVEQNEHFLDVYSVLMKNSDVKLKCML